MKCFHFYWWFYYNWFDSFFSRRVLSSVALLSWIVYVCVCFLCACVVSESPIILILIHTIGIAPFLELYIYVHAYSIVSDHIISKISRNGWSVFITFWLSDAVSSRTRPPVHFSHIFHTHAHTHTHTRMYQMNERDQMNKQAVLHARAGSSA